jgi:hypothetical protein
MLGGSIWKKTDLSLWLDLEIMKLQCRREGQRSPVSWGLLLVRCHTGVNGSWGDKCTQA